jgi:hypothetical protein
MNKLEKALEDKRMLLGMNKADFVAKELKMSYPTYQSLIKDPESLQIGKLSFVANYLGVNNLQLIDMSKKEA